MRLTLDGMTMGTLWDSGNPPLSMEPGLGSQPPEVHRDGVGGIMHSMNERAVKCCLRGIKEGTWRSSLTEASLTLITPGIKHRIRNEMLDLKKKKKKWHKIKWPEAAGSVVTLTWIFPNDLIPLKAQLKCCHLHKTFLNLHCQGKLFPPSSCCHRIC